MINRQLKLKLTKKQEKMLDEWLLSCASIYNFGLRKIELNAINKMYFGKKDFNNLLANHSSKIGIPSHTIQAVLMQVYNAWNRHFTKKGGKPKLKGIHNKLRSIPFPDLIKAPKDNKIALPMLGKLRFFKQDIPEGKIKCSRIIKKASGWYLQIVIDANHIFPIKETDEKVGIDTGIKHLAILSTGEKYCNKRFFVKSQKRLAQAQRAKNKQLVSRLNERIANQRKNYNHKVSREIIQNYKEIYVTNDNLKRQAKLFGGPINYAGIFQLKRFIIYKGDNHNRLVSLVDSAYTTMTCSNCGALTGPTGLSQLAVRNWECNNCGVVHDRDINSACVVLNFGLGYNLVNQKLLNGRYQEMSEVLQNHMLNL